MLSIECDDDNAGEHGREEVEGPFRLVASQWRAARKGKRGRWFCLPAERQGREAKRSEGGAAWPGVGRDAGHFSSIRNPPSALLRRNPRRRKNGLPPRPDHNLYRFRTLRGKGWLQLRVEVDSDGSGSRKTNLPQCAREERGMEVTLGSFRKERGAGATVPRVFTLSSLSL